LPSLSKNTLGFTLAELLITLAILGIIATFTIPKLLAAQQTSAYNAKAKEAAAMVAAAYTLYGLSNTVNSSTRMGDLTPYFNYVLLNTTSTIDDKQTQGSLACSTASCLLLHNGGIIRYSNNGFAGTTTTNALEFFFDPNGTYGNTTNGPDKSVQMFLYYNGRLTTRGTSLPIRWRLQIPI
jgi:prepilin-type N-terminal cleavage/methylation domain-containing protein